MDDPAVFYRTLREEIETVLLGMSDVVERLTIALLTNGHVLIEGPPGVAKTTAARLLARASGLDTARIQLTPDVRPADITGTHVYRQNSGEFEFRPGPVFANVIVADEINRGTPQTQSALLEAMEEGQVTVEGETVAVPQPFMLIATQNPIETAGTFDLPIAQRDRFQFRLNVEQQDRELERTLLNRVDERSRVGPGQVEPVVDATALEAVRRAVRDVHVEGTVKEYILDLVRRTREHPRLSHGASLRASYALLEGGKARAAINDRRFVTPDDVRVLAPAVLTHRVIPDFDVELADLTVQGVVDEVVAEVDPPSGGATTDPDRPPLGPGGDG
jgi:MoxR-like ATPase